PACVTLRTIATRLRYLEVAIREGTSSKTGGGDGDCGADGDVGEGWDPGVRGASRGGGEAAWNLDGAPCARRDGGLQDGRVSAGRAGIQRVRAELVQHVRGPRH